MPSRLPLYKDYTQHLLIICYFLYGWLKYIRENHYHICESELRITLRAQNTCLKLLIKYVNNIIVSWFRIIISFQKTRKYKNINFPVLS